MKQIFIIGGMGAGKSTIGAALSSAGLPVYDFDEIGHAVLRNPIVMSELAQAFGEQIITRDNQIDRKLLGKLAFETKESKAVLDLITLPHIVERYMDLVIKYEKMGAPVVAFEASNVKSRNDEGLRDADLIIASIVPVEERLNRLVALGWPRAEAQARIDQQITDEQMADMADVIFKSSATPEELKQAVLEWWSSAKTAFIK